MLTYENVNLRHRHRASFLTDITVIVEGISSEVN